MGWLYMWLGYRLSAIGYQLSAIGFTCSPVHPFTRSPGFVTKPRRHEDHRFYVARLSAIGYRLYLVTRSPAHLVLPRSHEGTKITDSMWLGYRLSAIGYQLSAIGYRLSAISYQLSAIGYRLSALPGHPLTSSLV